MKVFFPCALELTINLFRKIMKSSCESILTTKSSVFKFPIFRSLHPLLNLYSVTRCLLLFSINKYLADFKVWKDFELEKESITLSPKESITLSFTLNLKLIEICDLELV